MKKSKIMLSSIIALSLTACGSGGSGDSGGLHVVDTIENPVYIGEAKAISSLGYSLEVYRGGFNGSINNCVDNSTSYYESERTLIFGASSNLPKDDYVYAATVVENKITETLDVMNILREDFSQYKGALLSSDVSDLAASIGLEKKYGNSSDPGYDRDTTLAALESDHPFFYSYLFEVYQNDYGVEELKDFIANTVTGDDSLLGFSKLSITMGSLDRLNTLYNDLNGASGTRYQYDNSKIVICIDAGRDLYSGWGSGDLYGITFGSNTAKGRRDAKTVIKHELVHHVQLTLTGGKNLERWFSEGQAVSLSGQSVSSSFGSVNPANAVGTDSSSHFYGNSDSEYADYGLTYNEAVYASSIGVESTVDMMLEMRKNLKEELGTLYYKAFESAFENNIKNLYDFKQNDIGLNGLDCIGYPTDYFDDAFYNSSNYSFSYLVYQDACPNIRTSL